MDVLGVDIGGTGIKGAPVNVADGELVKERLRVPTPQPAKPEPVAEILAQIVKHFGWTGPVGVTFPGVVKAGVVHTAANLGDTWPGQDVAGLFGRATGRTVTVLNDADAAGLAEVSHGAAKGQAGVVAMITLGTGIGSALFLDGRLLPNTELGHLEIRGKDAEHRASAKVRETHELSWEKWAKHVDEYLSRLEALISPDLIVIGGGVSKKADRFLPLLEHVKAPVVPAALVNNAGIIGAAMAAQPPPARRTRSRTAA